MKVGSFFIFLLVNVSVVTPIFPQSSTNSGSIYGKTLDIEGAPLSGVRVWLESKTIVPVSAATSVGGNFRFVNLPPGTYSLTFYRQDYELKMQKDLIVSTGEQVQINVVLEPASETTGDVSGSVTDRNGLALEGVSVTLKTGTLPQLQTTTASDGSYRFEGLPAGNTNCPTPARLRSTGLEFVTFVISRIKSRLPCWRTRNSLTDPILIVLLSYYL